MTINISISKIIMTDIMISNNIIIDRMSSNITKSTDKYQKIRFLTT